MDKPPGTRRESHRPLYQQSYTREPYRQDAEMKISSSGGVDIVYMPRACYVKNADNLRPRGTTNPGRFLRHVRGMPRLRHGRRQERISAELDIAGLGIVHAQYSFLFNSKVLQNNYIHMLNS